MRNPLSLPAFLAWVEKQPADGWYNFLDTRNCAFCQYLKSVGFEQPAVGGFTWRPDRLKGATRPIPEAIRPLLFSEGVGAETFGALASRLREQVS